MGTITVFIHFGGVWGESNKYVDYSVRGLIVPLDCTHSKLVEMIARRLGKDVNCTFTMNYQVFEHGPQIPIFDDYSLEFYVDLKKGENDKRCYPICVDVDDVQPNLTGNDNGVSLGTYNDININREPSGMPIHEHNEITYGVFDELPTLEEMGLELAELVEVRNDDTGDSFQTLITIPSVEGVAKGSVFKSKDLLVTSLSLLAIENRFQFRVVKSDIKFYWVKCINEDCTWNLKSSRTGLFGNFKIREMNVNHTCSFDMAIVHHRQATSNLVANCVKHKFLSTRRIYTPRDIIDDIHHTYGVVVSYDKAWRAREQAIQMIRGDPQESYGNLPAYMYRLEVSNPGSITGMKVDSDGRFISSYVALGSSISGWKHCKPVIVVDGTFLTSKHGGTLFTACTQDANNNIFILAFGVGDSENNDAWGWFLSKVKEAYGDRDDLCIVSDRHRSISNAVDKIFPDAFHAACTYHLLQNVKKEFGRKGKCIRQPFIAASRAYTIAEFEIHMKRLDAINGGIRGYLADVGFERWSRSHMTKDRYSTMTSNIAESVNSAIKYAKNYPIEALFECLRCTIQRWFSQNLKDAMSTFTNLGTRHDKMLKEMIYLSRRLRVHPSSDTLYQVNDETSTYVVDMDNKTCSCRRFQLDHIPCPHAVAVISLQNYSSTDYCSKYFSKDEYLAAYQVPVYPLGNKDDWNIPQNVMEKTVLAPISKRGPGRPKESRYKSFLEYKKRTRCGKCGDYDHNSRSCHNPTSLGNLQFNKRKRIN